MYSMNSIHLVKYAEYNTIYIVNYMYSNIFLNNVGVQTAKYEYYKLNGY